MNSGFIVLHTYNPSIAESAGRIWLNPDQIILFNANPESGSEVMLAGTHDVIRVQETPEQIERLLVRLQIAVEGAGN